MFCEKCGAQVPENAELCPGCGESVAPAAEAVAPEAPVETPVAPETAQSTAQTSAPINLDTIKASIDKLTANPENKKTFGLVAIIALALTAVLYIFHSITSYSEISAALGMLSAFGGVSFGGFKVFFWIVELAFIAFVGYCGYTYYIGENKTDIVWKVSLVLSGFTLVVWIGSLIWNAEKALFSGSTFNMGLAYIFYSFTEGIIGLNIILCIVAVASAYLCKKMEK